MIHHYQGKFHLAKMCVVLGVSRSGYYAWAKRPKSLQAQENEQLLNQIMTIYQKSRRVYGSRKVTKALHRKGQVCGRNRVAKLMTENNLKSIRIRKYKATTNSKHNFPIAENLLAEAKAAIAAPNQAVVSDITYVPTDEGWLYLASVMDFQSKRLKGWAMGERMTRDLTIQAMRMALTRIPDAAGMIHHSDQGSQYASNEYRKLLADNQMLCSMSRKGNCYDNAWAESFNASVKMECIFPVHYKTRQEARQSLFEYIEIFYNRYRLHSSIDYLTPEEYEHLYAA
jgi:putative transposase